MRTRSRFDALLDPLPDPLRSTSRLIRANTGAADQAAATPETAMDWRTSSSVVIETDILAMGAFALL